MEFKSVVISIIAGTIMAFWTSCADRPGNAQATDTASQDSARTKKEEGIKMYSSMRELAFSATMEQFGGSEESDDVRVFGVIMEWGMVEGAVTLPCYQSGDASLYFSTGGGVIGGVSHPAVSEAAKKFVFLGQDFLQHAQVTEQYALPAKDEVKFYLLTNKGKYTAASDIESMENGTSVWLPMFESGNDVITELRLVNEK